MRKDVEKKLKKSIPKFVKKVDAIKPTTTWKIEGQTNREGPYSKSIIVGNLVRKQLNEKPEKIIEDLRAHYAEMDKLIPICSSPRGFKEAWDVRSNGQNITKYDIENIVARGGQVQLENRDTSENAKDPDKRTVKSDGTKENLLSTEGVGALYFQLGMNRKFIKLLRHNPNPFHTYHDEMNEQYVFKYQPTGGKGGLSGALRYRWMEELSSILKLELVILIVLWFEQDVNDTISQILFVAPAKIVSKKKTDLNKSLFKPLELEIISQKQFYEFKDNLHSVGEDVTGEIKRRTPLDTKIAHQWSYEQIKDTDLGKRIKNWARLTGRKCPQCDRKFDSFSKNKEIAFGHIIARDWANSFTFLLGSVNHPDNLYLSCQSCNSTLSNRFPDFLQWPKKSAKIDVRPQDLIQDKKNTNMEFVPLRDKIENYGRYKGGTIGDWIRNHKDEIKKTKL